MSYITQRLIVIVLFLGAPFFFVGGPGSEGSRSYIALWDLGHILFFFLTSLWLCKYFFSRSSTLQFRVVFCLIFFLVLILGVTIEGLQSFTGERLPDIKDVLRNQLGCLLALSFFCDNKNRKIKYLRLGTFTLLVIACIPLVRAVVDERVAKQQFPVLSDFETELEIDRWRSNGVLAIEDGITRHGKKSLKVLLTTNKYSGVSLVYFPGSWKDYSRLLLSVYNPGSKILSLECRIHDSTHKNRYNDRFNCSFSLKPGWNDLAISLAEVEKGPVDRVLNLAEVQQLQLFVVSQKRELIIYVDSVYLQK